MPEPRRRMQQHSQILVGLALGAAAGVAANLLWGGAPGLEWFATNVTDPIGQIFLRLLFMVVVPLVFTSLTLGVAALGDVSRLGRMGVRTLLFFIATTALAASLGLALVNVIGPGHALDPAVRADLLARYTAQGEAQVAAASTNGFGIGTIVNLVPRNPIGAAAAGEMLPVIFFALVFGIALIRIPKEKSEPVLRVLDGVAEAVMVIIGFAMRLAPLGVAALIFSVAARFGFDVFRSLALFVAVVLGGLLVHQIFVIGSLAWLAAGIRPLDFFSRARALMITAFSTSSSNATLPTTIRTAERAFGVPPHVAGFVLPLGATMNMNGTALFEGMTVLFLAQVFGIDLSLTTQLVVIALSVVTALGTAGVPGGSIPLLVMVLETVGVPGAAIALVLGVDRLLDMARTVPNVTGDLLTSLVITRSERLPLVVPTPEEEPAAAAAA